MKKQKDKPAMQPGKDPKYPFLLPGHSLHLGSAAPGEISLQEAAFLLPREHVHRSRIKSSQCNSSQIVGKVGQATIVRDKPGKSVSPFDLALQIAKQDRERGQPIDDLTRRWIEVPEWTPEHERDEIQSFLRPNDDPMGPERLSIRVHLNGSKAAARALGDMARNCLNQLQGAADKIREDEFTIPTASIAAEELAWVIGAACCKINELARTHPQVFQRFSRKLWKWPVMKSTYQEFGDDEKTLLTQLQLGKDLPLRLDRKAQWERQIEDDAGRIAWQLLWYVWRTRKENNPLGADYGRFGEIADALARPNKTSALKWWGVAKAALLHSYPEPEKVDEFNCLVTAPSKRRSSGRIRQAIFDILKARFISLVKATHRVKKSPHLCDCGKAAVRHTAEGWICERCDTLEHTR